MKQNFIDTKEATNRNTVIVRDFNTPLTSMDISSRQKIKKKTVALKDTLEQMYLINISRAFHPKAEKYTLFSNAYETFSRIHHMLGHKTSLNKFKKIEIISSIFSDHNGIKLKINHRKKKLKNTQHGG